MTPETLITLLIATPSAGIALFSAIYAKRQAQSARLQVKEAAKANTIAAEQLALVKLERAEALKVIFRFRPRRNSGMDYLDLVNAGPYDTYVVNAQLSGPGVDPHINGQHLSSLNRLGGTAAFVAAKDTLLILDAQGAPGSASRRLMSDRTVAQLTLTLKTEGILYEVRTDVILSAEQGFSTNHTQVTPL